MRMQEIAEELYESWVNGNRKSVIERLCTPTATRPNRDHDALRARTALLGGLLATSMNIEERVVFFTMLENRMQGEG